MNLTKKCKYCDYVTDNGRRLGGHMASCKKNPNDKKRREKLRKALLGNKLSDETKKKISESRKKYLKENPDKVPYLLNHSRKESYPEKYFTNIFDKNNLKYDKSYRIGLYELDFSITNKKIDIEIDGDQHYLDKKIVESDKRRNKFLKNKGWDIIRIKWSEYQKMDKDQRKVYINNLLSYINGLVKTKPEYIITDKTKYCKCGAKIYKYSKNCVKCYSINQRKVKRPNFNQLKEEIKNLGYNKTGRKYNVSDNTIRKWVRFYEKNENKE